jgi:pimeloyl-ACP methyl ester carboxylesterase
MEAVMTEMTAADGVMSIHVPIGTQALIGDLVRPTDASGIVLFAHGSGSSRFSPRNQFVARAFNRRGLATLLIDLLTPAEEPVDEATREYRFDIPLLARRVEAVVDWVASDERTAVLPIVLFGASTGAAAALIAAANRPARVRAVVSRGGRPDLAGASLPAVVAPTLLIVGGLDVPVIALNRSALARMRCDAALEIVPGATHLFEEPGTLERVAALAAEWFVTHGAPTAHGQPSR